MCYKIYNVVVALAFRPSACVNTGQARSLRKLPRVNDFGDWMRGRGAGRVTTPNSTPATMQTPLGILRDPLDFVRSFSCYDG